MKNALVDPETLVILCTASAGLGHLRVAHALESAAPKGMNLTYFASPDKATGVIHRFMSIHPLTRMFMEWTQTGSREVTASYFYKRFIKNSSKHLVSDLKLIFMGRTVKRAVFVCTHFGLAYEVSAQRAKIEREFGIETKLVVVVTDDSPQLLWGVPGADLIVTPSNRTSNAISALVGKNVQVKTVPYPLSQDFSRDLSEKDLTNRINQLNGSSEHIHISIPISGAAVGLDYIDRLIRYLTLSNPSYLFHIISKKAPFTVGFLRKMKKRMYISTQSSKSDIKVVSDYEELFKNEIVAFEIVKPSEQAFKALLCPSHRGGVILLLTDPVGRQEYDNLDFLSRHGLIPTRIEQQMLWQQNTKGLTPALWRGVRLPSDPVSAGKFINWCIESGLFSQMVACRATPQSWDSHANEMGWLGGEKFWTEVENLI